MKTAVVIGRGKIGSSLIKELRKNNWRVKFSLDNNWVYRGNKKIGDAKNYRKYIKNVDCAFLAIPTFDNGKAAFDFIKCFAQKNIPIVTCEKGSLANYYFSLRPFANKIGYNATVGGGTRLLEYLHARNAKDFTEIVAVVNGTLNFIFDEIACGQSIGKAVSKAIQRGYTEPGATKPLDVVNSELRDVFLKSVILFNVSCLSSKTLCAKNIQLPKVSVADLKSILQDKKMRCVVSISRKPQRAIGGFCVKSGKWFLSAGFKSIDGYWLPHGVNNALLIREKMNDYLLQGPGAGVEPTVLSMIQDASKKFAASPSLKL
ncbi:MAG: hypothetical protein A3C07_04225 [Candidatus Sungbacteria bacterium RIFCSPHIGHO2_02_FULL_47_11]|uniref:homoserine dehydrogenase n=1 Tax=Candidatus Sungbacteria bacterium RIFCSPHIGHO2_02_FULL_47_11 TaxID=1802270 RepID=A0A1G2KKQ6_9BACT|nr:MAG: hypothetical protein A3C07_04225 [Candidatus Sungbacteria bacterium RIFCSPHIGHO2_02_FULL_47_11]